MSRPTLIVHWKEQCPSVFALSSPPALQVAQCLINKFSLKCSLFQVIEVWHAWAWRADKAVPILARFGRQLFGIRVSFCSSQSRWMPCGLQLRGMRIPGLAGHGLGRSSRSSNVAPWLYKASSFGGGVAMGETHVWCSGFAGGWWSREMKKLAKRPERLVLKVNNKAESAITQNMN